MRLSGIAIVLGVSAALAWGQNVGYSDTPLLPGQKWKVHDKDRPQPKMITPGAKPGDPPSDAIVLFDGKDLAKWQKANWTVEEGSVYAKKGAGDLVSKDKFGDIQMHIEFSSPTEIRGASQDRGNSGVLLMSRYEIQVLDSWENPTYADGQAGSIYGQWPPPVNVSRKPGEWQTYDIVFEAPKFEGEKLAQPAFVTVFHNGVLMHHRKEIIGRMAHRVVGTYARHGAEESLALQDHDTRMRFRNIWVRRLVPYDRP